MENSNTTSAEQFWGTEPAIPLQNWNGWGELLKFLPPSLKPKQTCVYYTNNVIVMGIHEGYG